MRGMLKFGDIIIAACVIISAMLLLFGSLFLQKDGGVVRITVSGERFEYPLNTDAVKIIKSNDITLTVVIDSGCVYVESSDCPGGDCVACGTISRTGKSIVCLPAQVSITVVKGANGYDATDAEAG